MYETIKKEKSLLVIVEIEKERWPRDILADEFKNLVLSAGIDVEELIIVKRKSISASLYIGKGKIEEIAIIVQEKGINVVIFNNNLNSAQQRNLEDILGVKTIDRTQLILDIFAHHAHSREGILQVELAQLEYLLPRLKGKGIVLSRLGGGIGTRGPGEKKLEVDRRRISERITRLKKELQSVRDHRQVMRKKREKQRINVCSLVGYTNAGKSTLFNTLTESEEETSLALFTTLDTVSRTINVHNNLKAIITDTVGFIYKLPLNLVEAFKATLEELYYADLILHIIDSSSTDILRLMESVNSILEELKLTSKPILLIFNKIDKLAPNDLELLKKNYPEGVFISALKRVNLDDLLRKIYDILFTDFIEVIVKFPFNKMEIVESIHAYCEVMKVQYQEKAVVYWLRLNKHKLPYLQRPGVEIKEI